jgi:hypothetical protein
VVVYYTLIAIGGGVLMGLTGAVLDPVAPGAVEPLLEWVLPSGAAGAVVVAAWLVEAKQDVVENMAPAAGAAGPAAAGRGRRRAGAGRGGAGAMAARIGDLGWTPNRVAALGLNLVLLVNLAGAGRLSVRFRTGREVLHRLERWQTTYLPVYGLWAAAVVAVLPLTFSFD